jgi:hypothetical protein
MTLPDSVQIIVPKSSPGRPWEVDLKAFLRSVLGRRRKIRALGHLESMVVGGLRVTAFPFRGEMPPGLAHSWNCYLFESPRSAIACTADSDVGEEAIAFLTEVHRRRGKPLTLLTAYPSQPGTMPGYREEFSELYNPWRLYSWYLPLSKLFSPQPSEKVTFDTLRRLKATAGLTRFFVYAFGSAPWFRLGPQDPLALNVGSLSSRQWVALQRRVGEDPRLPRLAPVKYGVPMEVGA